MIDRQLEGGPAVTLEELMAIVPGPDFPTGAMMLGQGGARNAYATGRGSIMMRATHIIEEGRNARQSIALTSIPFQVGKAGLVEKIAEAARDQRRPEEPTSELQALTRGTDSVVGLEKKMRH